ncbi:RuvC family protein [Jiella pelagia]|uniref:Holliday junction nuclease RuvC n=1 Tax=Jiella pelagia TaxID=2986949 RepID=A0ABY7C1G2_9HYPH|nr:hypothetical protein [Jiella pelagia]WAP69066.1 hypothetical protein OH818_01645 [Jiella pelagia]
MAGAVRHTGGIAKESAREVGAIGRNYYLGVDLGTTAGLARLYESGAIDCLSHKVKPSIHERCVGLAAILDRMITPDCIGVCIEEPFSGQFSSVKALFPMMGVAVLVCEQKGVPWVLVNLMKLKVHATGKGNAKKEDMQAAAKARWGKDLGPDEADAAWAAAYMADRTPL